MFPSFADLEFHANTEIYEFEPLGTLKNAYILRRRNDNLEQLWVKASDESVYRDAILELLRNTLKPTNDLHQAAIDFLQGVEAGIRSMQLRSKLSIQERNDVLIVLNDEIAKHEAALSEGCRPELFKFFDYTMNGDHVWSSSSLKNVPDAWVWLFPVPANANRVYGTRVEGKYKRLEPTTAARYLSSEIICKLLVSKMPNMPDEIPEAVTRIASQLRSNSKPLLERIELMLKASMPAKQKAK